MLVGLILLGTVGFALLAGLYEHTPVGPVDHHVAGWVADGVPGLVTSISRAASLLGTWSAWIVGIGLPLVLVVARRFRDALWAAATLAGIHLVVWALKDAFDRARPHAGSAIPLPDSRSFPSGHAAGAVVTFGVLAALAIERWPAHRYVFLALAAIIAGAIGTSRVILDVHFVSDVVAGWCLGIAWLSAALLVRDALAVRSGRVARADGLDPAPVEPAGARR